MLDCDDCLPPYSPASSVSMMSVTSDSSSSPVASPWASRSQADSPVPSPTSPQDNQQTFPRYHNIYEERLQPLQPSQSSSDVRAPPRATQPRTADPKLQARLHKALQNYDYQDLKSLLMSSGDMLDINEYNKEGQTPLQVACLSGQLGLVQLIMSHGADPSLASRDGWNTLHMAAYSGQSEIFQYILLCSKR